jgi:DNA helicase-2/ATP-dependent DNA helicase PcrA
MDASGVDYSGLNPKQREAVEVVEGPVMILAGAGSGKTRVLTSRIAHLIHVGAAFPGEIMALTFTNKAASEMKSRVERLLGADMLRHNELWVSTFHSTGARILRQYASGVVGASVGVQPGFTILDDSDQLSAIKDCMDRVGLSDKVVAPKAILHKINALKNEGISPRDFPTQNLSFMEAKMAPVLKVYEDVLAANNSLDFGDLLLKTYQLFKKNPDVLENFQERFRFFLVDEYQDTNPIQYLWLKLLAEKYQNICVVGDEDQSIYKWRGADIRNILDFEKDYPKVKVVKLEENYRSTANIIGAANRVIANNTQRKDKNLFTQNSAGRPVEFHFVERDLDEARFVAKTIRALVNGSQPFNEIAVLYRTNAQSRLLEDSLRYERFPYKIFGGLKFYDRAEIKDAVCYLRLLVNPRDDVALYRIINSPARGIGKSTIDTLKMHSFQAGMNALDAIGDLMMTDKLGSGPKNKLKGFVDLYAKLVDKKIQLPMTEFYSYLLEETGYLSALRKEESIESTSRIENLQELASAIGDFEERMVEPTWEGFLEEVALITDQDRGMTDDNYITMMTVHSAKGLEFSTVFIVGMEDGLFPSIRGDVYDVNPDDLEEERRLCYVGMTRAEKRLIMSGAKVRRVFGQTQLRRRSRFVDEMPLEQMLVHEIDAAPARSPFGGTAWSGAGGGTFGGQRSAPKRSAPTYDDFNQDSGDEFGGAFESSSLIGPGAAEDGFVKGTRVRHPQYGEGVILSRDGIGDRIKVGVEFRGKGIKKFVLRFAPLEILA